jgi:hypothetical protein
LSIEKETKGTKVSFHEKNKVMANVFSRLILNLTINGLKIFFGTVEFHFIKYNSFSFEKMQVQLSF